MYDVLLANSYTTNNIWNKPRLGYSIISILLLNCALIRL